MEGRIKQLTTSASYPHDCSLQQAPASESSVKATSNFVELIETHISLVLLTPAFVYKFRKDIKYPFVDFSTCTLRNEDCLKEVKLNRRLADDVYLGVAPLLLTEVNFP